MSLSAPGAAFVGLELAWRLLGVFCLAAAAACAASPRELSGALERAGPRARMAAKALFGLTIPAAAAAFKLAQLHGNQLMWDSGVLGNLAWRAAHGEGLTSSVIGGQPYLVVHFTLLPYLLGPLTRLGGTLDALAAAQGLALGSFALAAYLLAAEATRDEVQAWAVTLLALSTIYFHDLMGAVLDNSLFAPPLFLWAAYWLIRGRRAAAAAAACLLLASREHAPFLLAGAGLYAAAAGRGRERAAGVAAVVLAACCWGVEMRAIRAAQAGWADPWTRWSLFDGLGGTPEAAAALALHRPWALALALVWPPAKLAAPAAVLGSLALLPLASGWALLPALAAWVPNQLAGAGHSFHQLRMHYSAFVYGPLAFAAIRGLARAAASFPRRRDALCAAVFAAAGIQFLANAEFALAQKLLPAHWAVSVPRALALVPPDAAVWADEFLLPRVACRSRLKSLPKSLPDPLFDGGLFKPDRVLMSLYWARQAQPAARERVMSYLKDQGFEVVFRDEDLLVWAKP